MRPHHLTGSMAITVLTGSVLVQSTFAGDDSPSSRLHRLFDDEWERILKEDPPYASALGDFRYNGRWPDVSLAARDRSEAMTIKALEQARAIAAELLSPADRLNRRLFIRQYEAAVSVHPHRLHLIPLNQRGGIQNESRIADLIPFETAEDYESWILRLRAFPKYVAQTMAVMTQGIREEMLHPKVIMQRVPDQIRKQLVDSPQDSLYYNPFLDMPSEISATDQQRLQQQGRKAIKECILPSYRTFLEFFESRYLPACYDEVGCWKRPNGQHMYAALARKFTTTSLTPDEIHQIGQTEVVRIRREMEIVQREIGFDGTFQEFLVHLRSDRQFFYDNPNDLLQAYRDCCRRIDPQLPRLFHRLPEIRYEIRAIPAQMAPDTTTAYYQPPSADGSRPGGYYVNLYRPDMRPKYEVEALSLHESVPGHHLQIALAMELEDIPDFRRHADCTAFIEGWGLYSEKLGEELGLYQDPYSRFGQLTYEMWRAVRLVVDTGIHSKQWTRQQAIDFFASNTAKTPLDIINEVDRYIAWPGQALAYKIGEMKIRELRARAEEQLGAAFDVRDFHQVVLGSGAVPLDVLEELVDDWLK